MAHPAEEVISMKRVLLHTVLPLPLAALPADKAPVEIESIRWLRPGGAKPSRTWNFGGM
jgi:hypothetical protein